MRRICASIACPCFAARVQQDRDKLYHAVPAAVCNKEAAPAAHDGLSECRKSRKAAQMKRLEDSKAAPSSNYNVLLVQSIVVAINATKPITKHALKWTLSNVTQAGNRITLFAVIPSVTLANWRLWARLSLDCYLPKSERVKRDSKSDITASCFEMTSQLNNLCVEKKVQVHIRILIVNGKTTIATEAQKLCASWVILDRELKKDGKSCMAQLQCNLVLVHSSDNAKFLRMNLKREIPGADQLVDMGSGSSPDGYSSSGLLPGLSFVNPPSRGFDETVSSINLSFCRSMPNDFNVESDSGMSSIPSTASDDAGTTSAASSSTSTGRSTYNIHARSSRWNFAQVPTRSNMVYGRGVNRDVELLEISTLDPPLPPLPSTVKSYAGAPGTLVKEGELTSVAMSRATCITPSESSCSSVTPWNVDALSTSTSGPLAVVTALHGHHFSSSRHEFPASPPAAAPKHRPETRGVLISHLMLKTLLKSRLGYGSEDIGIGSSKGQAEQNSGTSTRKARGKAHLMLKSLKHDQYSGATRDAGQEASQSNTVKLLTMSTDDHGGVADSYDTVPATAEADLPRPTPSIMSSPSSTSSAAGGAAVGSPPPLCSVCKNRAPVFGRSAVVFTYEELREATEGFSKDGFLAEGGFGWVHRGRLADGQMIAVKQLKSTSSQGDKEFCSEVEVLSCAQHRNLVMLIGYCIEPGRRLLVYELVCNGSLASHLFRDIAASGHPVLEWSSRQKVAVGAARGLRYLHEDCRVGCIIHRDLRPSNILLTHDFEPLVGDFGLARCQHDGGLEEETRVLGTFGYLAPEYVQTAQLTEKADVYSFGVILLELISGRKAIDFNSPKGQQCLTEWARPLMENHAVDELIDQRLEGRFSHYEVSCMLHAASLSLRRDPHSRPRMSQILKILEGDLLGSTPAMQFPGERQSLRPKCVSMPLDLRGRSQIRHSRSIREAAGDIVSGVSRDAGPLQEFRSNSRHALAHSNMTTQWLSRSNSSSNLIPAYATNSAKNSPASITRASSARSFSSVSSKSRNPSRFHSPDRHSTQHDLNLRPDQDNIAPTQLLSSTTIQEKAP